MPFRKMAQGYANGHAHREACERITTRDVLGMLFAGFLDLDDTGFLGNERVQNALAEEFGIELSAIRLQLAVAPSPPVVIQGVAYCLERVEGLELLRLRATLRREGGPAWVPVERGFFWRQTVTTYCHCAGCAHRLVVLEE